MTEKPFPRPRRRIAQLLLGAIFIALAMVLSAGGPALAVDAGGFGIRPSNESDFFHLNLSPGAATDAVAVVSNHTSSPVTLLTYPVDAQNTPQGTFAFADQSEPPKGIGAWARLNVDRVTVLAGTETKVPFRLSVPEGTPPGDYAGGLVIQAPPVPGETTTVNGETAVRLDVVQRQAVRIYLKVAGTPVMSLGHGDLKWQQKDDRIVFTMPVTNTGNTILHPSADLGLTGWPVSAGHLTFETPESLLPGATLELHTSLDQAPLAQLGTAEAVLTSEAGVGRASAKVFYAPWLLLAGILAVLAAVAYGAWRVARFVRRAREALAQVASTNGDQTSRSSGH